MDSAFTIQAEDKLWPWTHTHDLFSPLHSLFKRWNTDWPMCVVGYQNQRDLQIDWYAKSVVELHWETYMQVRCQKHAHYFGRFAKVMCKAHPAEGLYAPIQRKSYMSGCLHTANACSYIPNLQLYIWGHIHLSIMKWAESLADTWSSCLFHEIDKCNVVLTIKMYQWKKNRRDNIRPGYCNVSRFNTMHNSMHHNIRKFKPYLQRTYM